MDYMDILSWHSISFVNLINISNIHKSTKNNKAHTQDGINFSHFPRQCTLDVKDMNFGIRMTWFWISALFLINYVFPGKLFHFPNLQLYTYKMGSIIPNSLGYYKDSMRWYVQSTCRSAWLIKEKKSLKRELLLVTYIFTSSYDCKHDHHKKSKIRLFKNWWEKKHL